MPIGFEFSLGFVEDLWFDDFLWGFLRICGLEFMDFGFDVGWFRCFVVDLVGFWFTSFGDMFGMKFYVFNWICGMRNVGKENL